MRELALVTGASSGIGLELARQFVEHGFDVIINAEDDELAAAESALAGGGSEVRAVKADLSTYDGVERLWSAVAAAGRPLDAAALNAGIGVNGDFTRDVPLEDDLRLIAVNVAAVVHLAKRVLPGMVERGAGRVLITSSVAATMPGPYYATYAASKAFLQSFAQAIRFELEDTGVTVTALQPGPTDTEFFERAGMEDTKVGEANKDDPAEVAKDGFEALMAGKDHVIAGSVKNKAQVAGGRLMPEKARAALHAVQTKPDADDD
jgi:short-subunit dehydrogenase